VRAVSGKGLERGRQRICLEDVGEECESWLL
jgi:hypothetical protein